MVGEEEKGEGEEEGEGEGEGEERHVTSEAFHHVSRAPSFAPCSGFVRGSGQVERSAW